MFDSQEMQQKRTEIARKLLARALESGPRGLYALDNVAQKLAEIGANRRPASE